MTTPATRRAIGARAAVLACASIAVTASAVAAVVGPPASLPLAIVALVTCSALIVVAGLQRWEVSATSITAFLLSLFLLLMTDGFVLTLSGVGLHHHAVCISITITSIVAGGIAYLRSPSTSMPSRSGGGQLSRAQLLYGLVFVLILGGAVSISLLSSTAYDRTQRFIALGATTTQGDARTRNVDISVVNHGLADTRYVLRASGMASVVTRSVVVNSNRTTHVVLAVPTDKAVTIELFAEGGDATPLRTLRLAPQPAAQSAGS